MTHCQLISPIVSKGVRCVMTELAVLSSVSVNFASGFTSLLNSCKTRLQYAFDADWTLRFGGIEH